MLKCILPFLIIIHHCACRGFDFLGPFKFAGVTIVTFFYIVSGYGLMHNYLEKGNDYFEGFLWKKIKQVIIPYLLSLFVYISVRMIFGDIAIKEYLMSNSFQNWLPYSWFIFSISLSYLFFFVIFSIKCSSYKKLFLYFCFQIVYAFTIYGIGGERYWWAGFIGVTIGMLWRLFEKVLLRLLQNWKFSMILLGSSLILFVTFSKYINFKELHPLFTGTILIVTMNILPPFGYSDQYVKYVAKLSIYIYLLQSVSMFIVLDILNFTDTFTSVLLIWVVDIGISALVNGMSNFLYCVFAKKTRG